MSDIKINQLTEASTITNDDYTIIDNGTYTKKVKLTNQIVDNLTSTDTNKPLSANQGSVLRKKFIRNLLKINLSSLKSLNTSGTWNNNVYTINGVTITYNNGTVTVNGTASGRVLFYFSEYLSTSNVRVNGCPTGGTADGYHINIPYFDSTKTYASETLDVGSGANISTQYPYYSLFIFIESGVSLSNKVFKPMITDDLNATYNDFLSWEDSIAHNSILDNFRYTYPLWLGGIYVNCGNGVYKVMIPLEHYNVDKIFSIQYIDISNSGSFSSNITFERYSNVLFVTSSDLLQNSQYVGYRCAIYATFAY